MIVSNASLISNYNNNIITLYCHTIYIVSITILIVNSIDLVILLSICPLGKSLYSSVISERYLYIIVFITLFIVFSKTIDLYVSGICFVFCDLSGLVRIMMLILYRCFGKYSYMKLVFVILTMMVARGLSYIFRNPMNR